MISGFISVSCCTPITWSSARAVQASYKVGHSETKGMVSALKEYQEHITGESDSTRDPAINRS